MSVFSNLPLDIVNIILSYDNVIRFRNGRYINQIPCNDARKQLLKNIPLKYEFDFPSEGYMWNISSLVVLHINNIKYYSLQCDNTSFSMATFQHSGIDYQNPQPGDEDESTILLDVLHIV